MQRLLRRSARLYGPLFRRNQGRRRGERILSPAFGSTCVSGPPAYRTANRKSRRTSGRLFACCARDLTMKSDIHPNYHMIKVVMTNGDEFMTRSTYGEEGATLHLDIDPQTHPAWTGGSQQLVDRGGRLSRFNTRFGGLSIGGKK